MLRPILHLTQSSCLPYLSHYTSTTKTRFMPPDTQSWWVQSSTDIRSLFIGRYLLIKLVLYCPPTHLAHHQGGQTWRRRWHNESPVSSTEEAGFLGRATPELGSHWAAATVGSGSTELPGPFRQGQEKSPSSGIRTRPPSCPCVTGVGHSLSASQKALDDRRVSGKRCGGGRKAGGPGGTLTDSSIGPSSIGQVACSGMACSHAALAFSPRANQGISRNDYNHF